MAGLLDIFGTGGTQTLGLLGMSPEDIQRNRDDAQAQALYGLAARLFQGGNTGQSIAEGLQQGQKLYSAAMQNQLQEQVQGFQMKDLLEKRKLEKDALARQALANRLLPSLMQRGSAAVPAQIIEEDGRYIGETPAVAAKAGGINMDVFEALSASPEGQKSLLNFLNLQKALSGDLTKVGPDEQLIRFNPLTNQQEVVATGAPKQNLTKEYNNWVLAGSPGTFQAFLKESNKPLVVMNEGQKGFENTTDLKKQFGAEPIYKEFAGMQTAYSQVTNAIKQGTPIGDTAAATKIMKLLDPGSVVRETELGMAMAATGKMDRLQNYLDLYISGKKLTPTQRSDFQALADQLYNAAAVAYNNKRGEYEQIGQGFKLNTDLALGKPAKIMSMPSGGVGDLASQAAAELEKRRKQ